MFVDMIWQDVVFSVGQVVFIIALLPTVLGAEKPPFSTSLLSGSVLLTFAFTFASLGLWPSALSAGGVALLWFILAIQKRRG